MVCSGTYPVRFTSQHGTRVVHLRGSMLERPLLEVADGTGASAEGGRVRRESFDIGAGPGAASGNEDVLTWKKKERCISATRRRRRRRSR